MELDERRTLRVDENGFNCIIILALYDCICSADATKMVPVETSSADAESVAGQPQVSLHCKVNNGET